MLSKDLSINGLRKSKEIIMITTGIPTVAEAILARERENWSHEREVWKDELRRARAHLKRANDRATMWEGKFHQVKHENNKLRKMIWNISKAFAYANDHEGRYNFLWDAVQEFLTKKKGRS